MSNLLGEQTREVDIQIYFYGDLMYFESTYADAFFEAFSYVDRTLHEMNESAFILSRFFGGGIPAWNSKERKAIQQNVCKLLTKEIRR